MPVLRNEGLFQAEIISELRRMAAEGCALDEMVTYVQARLEFSREFIVPVLGYFCQAFTLPLHKVLPLREWWETREEKLVAELVSKIRSFT